MKKGPSNESFVPAFWARHFISLRAGSDEPRPKQSPAVRRSSSYRISIPMWEMTFTSKFNKKISIMRFSSKAGTEKDKDRNQKKIETARHNHGDTPRWPLWKSSLAPGLQVRSLMTDVVVEFVAHQTDANNQWFWYSSLPRNGLAIPSSPKYHRGQRPNE